MKPLRIGILGTGLIAAVHAKHLAASPGVSVAAVCGTDPAKATAFAAAHALSARVCAQFSDMLTSGLDALYVCLPPFAHDGQVEQAAAAGLHLFLEKPLALDAGRAGAMAAAITKAGVVSQVGFHVRHSPVGRRLRALIDSGEAGTPTLLTASYWANHLHAPWWRCKDRSGGQIFEQAIHAYDLVRFLLGEVATVSGHLGLLGKGDVPGYTGDDTSASLVRCHSGAMAVVSASNNAVPERWTLSWTLVCSRLTVTSATPTTAELIHTSAGNRIERIDGGSDAYVEETNDFLNAIRTGGTTCCPVADGLASQRVVEAVIASSDRAGAPVVPLAPAA